MTLGVHGLFFQCRFTKLLVENTQLSCFGSVRPLCDSSKQPARQPPVVAVHTLSPQGVRSAV
jgi:hypothetical protein